MSNGDKRYHAEVKVTLEGRDCRINIFADTLAEIFKDIGIVCTQFPQDWMSPAKREFINAKRKAATLQQQPQSNPPPASHATPTGETPPLCDSCGTDEFMELIEFTDRKTGRPRREWKCQQCNEWHWPNGKKR